MCRGHLAIPCLLISLQTRGHLLDAKASLSFVFCRARGTGAAQARRYTAGSSHPAMVASREAPLPRAHAQKTAHGISCLQLKRACSIVEIVAAQSFTTPYEIRHSGSVGTGSPGSVCHLLARPLLHRLKETSVTFVRSSELECVDREEQRSSVAPCTASVNQERTHRCPGAGLLNQSF